MPTDGLQENRLGILIEPSQVRLVTTSDDPYTWAALPEKRHLFSKNISDHSIGAYKELCEGIENIFEVIPAIAAGCLQGDVALDNLQNFGQKSSFTAKIDDLQGENARLLQELCQWRDQASAESQSRQCAEEEVNQLATANQRLQEEAQKNAAAVKYFKGRLFKYVQGMNRILPLLQELNADMPPM